MAEINRIHVIVELVDGKEVKAEFGPGHQIEVSREVIPNGEVDGYKTYVAGNVAVTIHG
ncbi:hypothetical protein GCM10007291_07230 [Gemmobacter nanjingensis]|uniref:Uncharacterized protein n=1 Tax=Gemmobacter nanjingensis TaxID=488454 RepID=A0ABQ3F845_9RHOB|nr:hypothetical protein [Gemmobacter nanjingensis]GHC12524.1 hypothetical protein GCM10007291_07230 [Gemmobacter nanjingensis]